MMKSLLIFLFPTVFLGLSGWCFHVYLEWTAPAKNIFIESQRKHMKAPVCPAFAAQEFLIRNHHLGKTKRFLPLTGPAKSQTVFCREDGPYLQYQTDRYGFHNLDEIWDTENWDAVFLGDSFVQGACVPSNANWIRLFQTQTQMKAVGNLGSYGNGPLAQLGSLLEYGKLKKPKRVFWVYIPNDLYTDLRIESQHPTMRAYLQGGTQELIRHQLEYENDLKQYLNQALNEKNSESSVSRYLGLHRTLQYFKIHRQKKYRQDPELTANVDFQHLSEIDWELYRQILLKAAQETKAWGGKLFFVILPHSQMVVPRNQLAVQELKMRLNLIVGNLGIPILDFHQEMMKQDKPLQFFTPLGIEYGHFNLQGYEWAAFRMTDFWKGRL